MTARQAAAWYIREGRRLHRAHATLSAHVSRRDNTAVFDFGSMLLGIGRRVAMGYQLETWTDEIYRHHLRATRPKRPARDPKESR